MIHRLQKLFRNNLFHESSTPQCTYDRLCIIKLAVNYRKAIAYNLIFIINCKLVYLEPIEISTNHIVRIIPPLSLRRIIFNSMYASPTTTRIGEYKTLYRLKLQLFWSHMRVDIEDWVK